MQQVSHGQAPPNCTPALEKGGAQLFELEDHALQRELFFRPQPSLPAHAECLGGIVRQPMDGLSQGHRIRRRHQQSVFLMPDQFGDAAHLRRDDRQ